MQDFLPVTKKEMQQRGWDQVDFVYLTGDAYVDHPSFGAAIISRLLESRGYRVGIIPQPDWRKKESVQVFGAPRLGFLVSAGNMDSMVNHYTVSRKHRQKDSYSPGGEMGLRPDMPTVVYSNLIRQTYKHTPIILGGIEASLRRLAHYDYWENKVRRSVLLDSGADLISYGMGEHSIIQIAEALQSGLPIDEITFVPGTVYKCKDLSRAYDPVILPSYETVSSDKKAYAESFAEQYRNTDPFTARVMAENYGNRGYVIQNPPALPLSQQEMDDVYDLPYRNAWHPMYDARGGIPALEEIKFSLTSNRGCFGGCNFCALTFHQGRIIQTRSHDVSLLRKLRKLSGVKKVFIRSGVRFDYVVADKSPVFLQELVKHHVSGQLRVAPEHVSNQVLHYMGKPSHEVYQQFLDQYEKANAATGRKQYAVPYFMSSHPGCTIKEAVKLAEYVRDLGFTPEQVQDFYPTPSTLSTCMYYTGIHPLTKEKVYIPRDPHEKAIQRALMQYKNPANRSLVLEGLKMAGRMDLVGFGPKCLIRPERDRRKESGRAISGAERKKAQGRKPARKTIRNTHKKK